MSATSTILTEQMQAIPVSLPHYTNDLMTCGILLCAFLLASVFSDRKRYFGRLLKTFFLPRENAVEGIRTTNIIYQRIFMYTVGLISTTLLLTLYTSDKLTDTIAHGMLWLVACISIILFYLLRRVLFAITNRIFFDPATTKVWEQSYACWTLLSSLPLYLLAVAALFLNLSAQTVILLLAICLVLLEICLLYKAFYIFSAKKYGILQIFVYLCTLELMPLLVAGKALVLFV